MLTRMLATCVAALTIATAGTVGAGAAEAQKQTVKVGAIMAINTGGGAISVGDQAAALEASVDAFNKRSKTVELDLTVCDSEGDANKEAACARELVDEGVVATLSDITLANAAAVNELLAPAGISRIGLQPSGLPDYQSAVVFPFVAGPVGQYATIGTELAKKGKTKLALIRPDLASAAALKGFLEPAIKKGGAEFVADIPVPTGATDYSPFVTAATSAGAEGVLIALSEDTAKQFLTAALQLNADFTVGTTAGNFPVNELKKLMPITKGAVIIDSLPAASVSEKQFPALKQFKADMKAAKDPALAPDKLKTTHLRSWVSVLAFGKFIEGLDTIDAASVLASVKAAQDVDLDGLTSPWTPSNPGPTDLFKQISQPDVWVMSFDGKKITLKEPAVNGYSGFQTT
jgi:ABC-type branched-subunit amino acid transport system substrate-binding protein